MIVVVGSGPKDFDTFAPLANLLSTEIQDITGLSLKITNTSKSNMVSTVEKFGWAIVLDGTATTPTPNSRILPNSKSETNSETSSIVVNGTSAMVSASGYLPLATATVTLLQAIEMSNDVDWIGGKYGNSTTSWSCSTISSWRIPHITVTDFPTFEYRGLMVDAARTNLTLMDLKNYVILARFYKLNAMHIHLSDTDAFTWPSTAFPLLAKASSHAYTLDEMKELAAFATVRGVSIIGEIDCPGHATGMVNAMPAEFGFPSHPSLGIIDFTNPQVVQRMQTIFNEIYEVFGTPIVHMGADEVDFKRLGTLPEIQAALQKQNLTSAVDLYREFIVTMDRFAVASNRTLHVWEGFAPSKGQTGRNAQNASTIDIDPKTGITVQPFDCYYYPPPQLAADGYKIINSAWTPLYIASGHGEDPELVYQWHPWLFGEVHDHLSWWEVPAELHSAVVGVEMAVWQTSAAATLSTLSERVPAMSDRSWSPYSMRSYADFVGRYSSTDAKLQHLLLAAPSPPPAPPPVPNGAFSPVPGACRDQNGFYGPRLEHDGNILLAQCVAYCMSLGERCDAYDIKGQPGDTMIGWCGIWGETLTATDASNSSVASKDSFVFRDGSGTRVCQGVVKGNTQNTCFHRPPLC